LAQLARNPDHRRQPRQPELRNPASPSTKTALLDRRRHSAKRKLVKSAGGFAGSSGEKGREIIVNRRLGHLARLRSASKRRAGTPKCRQTFPRTGRANL